MHMLVLGGNSDIGLAIARQFARHEGAHITLASRNTARLESLASDLEVKYQVTAAAAYFDATDYASHDAFYAGLDPKPDAVVLAFGQLGEQTAAQLDFSQAKELIETNYLGAVSILEIVARDFSPKGRGLIIGISSVAGLRGRTSNYIYGSAKAGLLTYLSGLRHRLHAQGVQVITVLPGFVRTRMTQGLDLPDRLTAEPEQVAKDVWQAWKKGRSVVYSKWIWRYIMWIIRFLPERIFLRTKL